MSRTQHSGDGARREAPSASIGALLARRAACARDAPALLAPGREPLAYAELLEQAARVAAALHGMGLGEGSRVAVVLPAGPELALALVCVAATVTCVPLSFDLTEQELRRYLALVRADAVVTHGAPRAAARRAAAALGVRVLDWVSADAGRRDRIRLVTGPSPAVAGAERFAQGTSDAFLMATSGTTSQPKLVPVTHASVCLSAHNTGRTLALGPADTLLNVLPLTHAHGLFSGLMVSLGAGAGVVCTPGYQSPRHFFEWLREFRPTWVTAVPAIYRALLPETPGTPRADTGGRLRLLRCASAPMPAPLLRALEEHFGVPVIETYGMTEATSQIAANPLPPAPRKAGSVGLPAGPDLRIVGSDGATLPVGDVGGILLRGATLTRGYDAATPGTGDDFVEGWFRTGDLGHLDGDGYLFIAGRSKDVINRGGAKIAPAEVEAALLEHPAVVDAFVFGAPDPLLGEEVAAALVLAATRTARGGAIRRFLGSRLAPFKLPASIAFVQEIPRGPTGKLARARVAERLLADNGAHARAARECFTPPRTLLERTLAALWQELLGGRAIGRDDDFFLCGGNSLVAVQMLARARELTGRECSVQILFDASTLTRFAARVEALDSVAARHGPAAPAATPGAVEHALSYPQLRLYLLSRLDVTGYGYHVLEVLRLRGALDVDALRGAVRRAVARHDALRTRFVERDGVPVARVEEHVEPPLEIVPVAEPPPEDVLSVATPLARDAHRKPFDLGTGPLLRVRLLRVSEREHVLILCTHHLVTDGWSQRVLGRELWECYAAAVQGREPRLPPPGLRYEDFTTWQRGWLETPDARRCLGYWERRLRGASDIPLPADRPRPERWTGGGARVPLQVPGLLVARLRALADEHGATLFMVILAAFKCLLHRYARHDDITVGSLFAGRRHAMLDDVVGPVANTVALRTSLCGDPTFATLLRRVRQTVIEALEHQSMPFERVVESLNPPRRLNRNALFHVMCVLHADDGYATRVCGLDVEVIPVDPGTARFDLVLELVERDAELTGFVEYSTDLFDGISVERMVRHLGTVLEAVPAHPDLALSRLPLLDAAERTELLERWNQTDRELAPDQGFVHMFCAQARRTPSAIAVSGANGRITYSDLERRSARLAEVLRARGAGADSVIALHLERGIDFVVALIGILRAGAAFLPVDPLAPAARLTGILARSEACIVLTGGTSASRAREAHAGLPAGGRPDLLLLDEGLLDERSRGDTSAAMPVSPGGGDLAYVIYTSGSTGAPKGAMVEHRGMANHLLAKCLDLEIDAADVVAQTAPQSFDICVWQCLTALLAGARTHVLDDETVRDVDRLAAAVAHEGVTILEVVPSLLRPLVEGAGAPARCAMLRRLRWMLSTGEALSPGLCRRWFECCPTIPLMNAYGPTECSDDVTHHPMRSAPPVDAVTVPIGLPIVNTRLFVLDGHLEPVPYGVAGELYVAGAGVGRGYLNDPQQTARSFLDDPFAAGSGRLYRTGDLVRRRTDGVLELVGRADHLLKLRGHRIEPEEIEHHLARRPEVANAVVLVRDDLAGGGRLVAYVVAAAGREVDWAGLRGDLAATLPAYMVPTGFVLRDTLPLTPNGKVDRRALAQIAEAVATVEPAIVAPASAAETKLVAIWRELLEIETVGTTQSFFDLGGHSLLATRLSWRISEVFGVTVDVATVFESPTIVEQARTLDAAVRRRDDETALVRLAASGPRPVSTIQMLVLRAERLFPGFAIFNLPSSYRLAGPVDFERLRQSLAEVVSRHEMLRTSFDEAVGDGAMVVTPPSRVDPSLPVESIDMPSPDLRARKAELIADREAHEPFDLARAPLFRVRVLRIADDDHALLLTFHHIICDGWSAGVFHQEVSAVYASLCAGAPPGLPALAVGYADFVDWQNRWLESQAARRMLDAWRRRLAGARSVLAPRDAARAGIGPESRWQPVRLEHGLRAAIETFGNRSGTTAFVVMLTAFKAVLLARTGERDLSVATVMANRAHREVEHVIGPLENTVVMRTRLTPDLSFRAAVQRVRQTVVDGYLNEAFPFEEMARRLAPSGDLDPEPLTEVFFILQNAIRRPLNFPGVHVAPFGDPHRQGQSVMPLGSGRLTLLLRETPAETVGACTYREHDLEDEWVVALLADFIGVLSRGTVEPDRGLGSLVAD